MSVRILIGDCVERMGELADASVDSVVCDPPYHLVSIHKRFAKSGGADRKPGSDQYGRLSRGFMGQTWDGGDVAFREATWAEVLRVLKPGGHLVAFSGTRTYHRMVVAIEDAGFEIRDMLSWLYGSGFPKSHDVAKGIDKQAGERGEIVPSGSAVKRMIPGAEQNRKGWKKDDGREYQPGEYVAATEAASEWQGWGTALKPACEPIVLARKPLAGTVASNVLEHGTGAINIRGCRIDVAPADDGQLRTMHRGGKVRCDGWGMDREAAEIPVIRPEGRWPANIVHDGSDEVVAAFPDGLRARGNTTAKRTEGTAIWGNADTIENGWAGDSGSAARFFYSAKATSAERGEGNTHPTVKPIDLMRWLVRLVTPKGGVVLDPFMGSGTTGIACQREGFDFIGCEMSPDYAAIAERRLRDDAGLFAEVIAA